MKYNFNIHAEDRAHISSFQVNHRKHSGEDCTTRTESLLRGLRVEPLNPNNGFSFTLPEFLGLSSHMHRVEFVLVVIVVATPSLPLA